MDHYETLNRFLGSVVPLKIRDCRIKRQTLDLGREPLEGGSAVGPNVEVVDCRLNLAHPRSVLIVCATVTNSVIHAQKQADGLSWPSVYFRGCSFTGKYFDTRFGVTSPQTDLYPQAGGLEDCDFSEATLHLCTFHNCDPATIKFPPWPHVTILHDRLVAADWLAIPFPPSFRTLQQMYAEPRPGRVATTLHRPTFAKEEKDDTDPEWIRQLLVGRDYVVF